MAKGSRGRRRVSFRQCKYAPYTLPGFNRDVSLCPNKCPKVLESKDWEDVTCSVCMECPHNAVLLLCSSHDKGCRPFMCGTSFRYSNCLDQYKKAYSKGTSSDATTDNPVVVSDSPGRAVEKREVTELACPLCRGKVKGLTVVEPAREFLNAKKRNCMQDDCSFVGTYKELRKHVKIEHPSARPREVDPTLEQKWRRLERDREHDDVISTIRSTMPGAMVFGDYVIEGDHYGLDTDEEGGGFEPDAEDGNGAMEVGFDRNLMNVFLLLHAFGGPGNGHGRQQMRQADRGGSHRTTDETPVAGLDLSTLDNNMDSDGDDEDDNDGGGMSLVSRLRRHGRVLLGRSGRRRRDREGI